MARKYPKSAKTLIFKPFFNVTLNQHNISDPTEKIMTIFGEFNFHPYWSTKDEEVPSIIGKLSRPIFRALPLLVSEIFFH